MILLWTASRFSLDTYKGGLEFCGEATKVLQK